MNKKVSWGLIVIGIALLCVGTVYPSLKLVVVVTDNTPPLWLLDNSGVPVLYPIDQGVYSDVSSVLARVEDPESGVTSVVVTIDGTQYNLSLSFGTAFSGLWWEIIPPLGTGAHSIKYVATNGVGLNVSYNGQFFVTKELLGNWYVNDLLVTSANQTFYFQTLTVNFRFVKTSGIDDSQITCDVAEGGTQHLILQYQGSSTWAGSYTFTAGTHTLALRASDGVNSIIMSLLNIDFGGVTVSNEQVLIFASAAICICSGGYGLLTSKKRKK